MYTFLFPVFKVYMYFFSLFFFFLHFFIYWSTDDCFFVCRLSKAADLDHHWVAKAWLSDVGLPQYSQAFHNHLVDGRMLNSLNRHDLERHLNITKKFHQISLLLGIELLQLLQFDKEVRKNVTSNRLQVWM